MTAGTRTIKTVAIHQAAPLANGPGLVMIPRNGSPKLPAVDAEAAALNQLLSLHPSPHQLLLSPSPLPSLPLPSLPLLSLSSLLKASWATILLKAMRAKGTAGTM